MSDALTFRGVRKSYGRQVALDGLDLAIPRGVVCGLIGPNGAGKTTTFGIAGGYVIPDGGSIDMLGMGAFDPAKHRGRITLLPQDCELNPHTPVRELLAFLARLQGMTAGEALRDADRVLDLVALSDRANSRVRQLSHGMKRRVAVAQALLGNPELVMLDEPTGGLDPDLVVRMRDLFRSQQGKRTLVVSSHVLSELEAACDHVVFLEHGRCVKAGPLAEVTGRAARVRITLEAKIEVDLAKAVPAIECSWDGATLVLAATGLDAASLNAAVLPVLLAGGGRVLEIRLGESLEAVWMTARRA